MNKIYEKNVGALKDQKIKKILEAYQYVEKPQLVTTNGYNLLYKGKYIHSEQSPIAEAMDVYNNAQNKKNIIHIIYGLGLGYLFQITAKNFSGKIILYEPNMDILASAFTLVDFSEELNRENVYIFSDFDKLIEFIVENTEKETDIDILSIESYRQMYKDIFQDQIKQLELVFGSIVLDYGFKEKRMKMITMNVLKNIPILLKETPINCLENIYEGKTAIIVSAGPTLSENIEILKKYQENAIIFVVGPACRTLIKNGIKPDFLCIIESFDCSKQVVDLDLSDVNLIVEPYTNNNTHKLNVKNKFLHISSNMPPAQYFASIVNIDTQNYCTKGTVSFTALDTAVNMGFKKIILIGQDLSYIDGQCYSKDSTYEDLVCKLNPETNKYEIMALDFDKFAEKVSNASTLEKRKELAKRRLISLNSVLYSVKGIDGKMVPTEAGYASFIKHFSDYAKSFADIEFINTSMKGAQIDGFKNIPLKIAMKDSKKLVRKKLDSNYIYNLDIVKNNLSNILKNFNEYGEIANECGKIVSRLIQDSKRNKTIDKERLLKIRKLIENYTIMNDFKNSENIIFRFLTIEEDTKLKDFLKTVQSYNEENTPIVINYLKEYYTKIKTTIEAVKPRLIDIISEVK